MCSHSTWHTIKRKERSAVIIHCRISCTVPSALHKVSSSTNDHWTNASQIQQETPPEASHSSPKCSLTLPYLALCHSPPSQLGSTVPCGLTHVTLFSFLSQTCHFYGILVGLQATFHLFFLWLVREQVQQQRKRLDAKDLLYFDACFQVHIYVKGQQLQ